MLFIVIAAGLCLCKDVLGQSLGVEGSFNEILPNFEVKGEEMTTLRIIAAHRETRSPESPEEREVVFDAFNSTFNLKLLHAYDLLSPTFSINLRQKEANKTIPHEQLTECIYRGTNAAFNLCDDMRGIVVLSSNEFLSVQPIKRHKRLSEKNGESYLIRRMVSKEKFPVSKSSIRRRHRSLNIIGRKTRITIETAIFVDAYLYKHMAQENFSNDVEREVTHIVLTMMNAVQLLYQDDSLGYNIHFQVQRIEIWTHQPTDLMPGHTTSSFTQLSDVSKNGIYDIDRYLNRFCQWQSKRNPIGDQNPNHWDHALLLTGVDLFAVGRDGVTRHQIVGLAPIGGMCTPTSSCTVNEGRHFESVYVVAHEIGHNLGMKHDGNDAGNDCDSGSFVMSPTLGSGKTQWSPCSRHYLDSFLNTPQSACLYDSSWIPEHLNHNSSGLLPGERYSADEQCMLRHGKGSRKSPQILFNEICRDLRCLSIFPRVKRQINSGVSQYTSHPALEGTPCGDNMWCRRGRCTTRPKFEDIEGNANANEIDSWKTTNTCASGCLYGDDLTLETGSVAIATQMQICKSRKSCHTGTIRYQTCDGSEICARINRTTVQQYTDDICARASQQNTSILAKGVQQISADAFRSCQVWCYMRAGGLMSAAGWTYPDGTRCQTSYDSKHFGRLSEGTIVAHFCVTGRCQEFSCDERSPFQLHPSLCRKDSTESNFIYDFPLPSHQFTWQVPTNEKTSQPYRPNQLENLLLSIPSATRERHASRHQHEKVEPMRSSDLEVESFGSLPLDFSRSTWTPISSCRSGCLTSSKGLRLVKKLCESSYCDSSNTVQLCIPNDQECPQLQPISVFANQVCQHQLWSDRHRGYQIWSPSLPDNACMVHCKDKHTNELLAVKGEVGWFPSGTLCDRRKPAYCLSGRCVEFDDLGVPK